MGLSHQVVADRETLLQMIPQRPPMVMVDALVYSDDVCHKTEFRIIKRNVFVADTHFSEAGLIENIAQTAAAGLGYGYYRRNEPIPTGYIGAVQKLNIETLPDVDEVIQTTVKIVHTVMNVNVASGVVYCDKKPIASCEMKLFLLDH